MRLDKLGDQPVLLEELVAERLARGAHGHLRLLGGPGSGRTTALQHLADLFGARADLVLRDGSCVAQDIFAASHALLVSSSTVDLPRGESWAIAPWAEDDRIEYLLARHPAACASVTRRSLEWSEVLDLDGHPALWAQVLDRLALDPELPNPVEALAQAFGEVLDEPDLPWSHLSLALDGLRAADDRTSTDPTLRKRPPPPRLFEIALAVPGASLLLGALAVRRCLVPGTAGPYAWCEGRWRTHAVDTVALVFPCTEEDLGELERGARHEDPNVRTKTLGVLHQIDPQRSVRVLLASPEATGAKEWRNVHLDGLECAEARLAGLVLRQCRLRRANLERAHWSGGSAVGSDFSEARLQGAHWERVSAPRACFRHADAPDMHIEECDIRESSWISARAHASHWERVEARESEFNGADFGAARMKDCKLTASRLGSVDFSGSEFEGCGLSYCDFRSARLEGTVFKNCGLRSTEWSGVVAPGLGLSYCRLSEASLTASVLTGADLHGSSLVGAGLADISWVGCDLRDVDFSQASFHLGSTRSGLLVGAPPSWGTRTGFYPHDDQLEGRSRPDAVRKADLRDSDLRGAVVDRCDFFLVDLRGAHLSSSQMEHLRRCKAILDREPRVE